MRKTIQVEELKLVTKSQYFCDDCGFELTNSIYSVHCELCGKDLCRKCIGHEENDGGDCSDYYCKSCWEIGEPYRKKIEILENKIDDLNIEWYSKIVKFNVPVVQSKINTLKNPCEYCGINEGQHRTNPKYDAMGVNVYEEICQSCYDEILKSNT